MFCYFTVNSKGTRTEKCIKCNRYIQMKDQAQHDIQNCKYPEVKAKKTEEFMPRVRNSANLRRDAQNIMNGNVPKSSNGATNFRRGY